MLSSLELFIPITETHSYITNLQNSLLAAQHGVMSSVQQFCVHTEQASGWWRLVLPGISRALARAGLVCKA